MCLLILILKNRSLINKLFTRFYYSITIVFQNNPSLLALVDLLLGLSIRANCYVYTIMIYMYTDEGTAVFFNIT